MRFAVLGSGSRGNATLVCSGSTRVLIDCGFTISETRARLDRLGVDPASLSAVVVTHEHGDHIGGVGPLSRRYGLPVWMTPGTCAAAPARSGLSPSSVSFFDPHTSFAIGGLEFSPLPVPHDAREPCQFVIGDGERRLGIVSDVGHVTPHMVARLQALDALLLEANHDTTMLAEGPYPPMLKARVGGQLGHLSNDQAAGLVAALECASLRHLVLTHLSEQNNTPQRARDAIANAIGCDTDWLGVADQTTGFEWRSL